jgi:four helix bundle protein
MMKMPFKKLAIWNKGMLLVKEIYLLVQKLPQSELYGLSAQMRRSVISIPSNIAEGSQRVSDRDFANFILIAKGSLAELNTQIEVCVQLQYYSVHDYAAILEKIEELDRMLRAFHKKLITSR